MDLINLLLELEQRGTGPDQSPTNPINSVRPMGPPIKKAPPQDPSLGGSTGRISSPATIPTLEQSPDVCKDCGMMHPPLPPGQKCPNTPILSQPGNPDSVDDATVNKHLVDLRNIIMTHISIKEIKNQKKLFQSIVIELAKFLENYNE